MTRTVGRLADCRRATKVSQQGGGSGDVRVVSPSCRCTEPPQSMCRIAVLILPVAHQPSLTTHHTQPPKTIPTRTHTKKKDSSGTREARLELPSQVAGMKTLFLSWWSFQDILAHPPPQGASSFLVLSGYFWRSHPRRGLVTRNSKKKTIFAKKKKGWAHLLLIQELNGTVPLELCL